MKQVRLTQKAIQNLIGEELGRLSETSSKMKKKIVDGHIAGIRQELTKAYGMARNPLLAKLDAWQTVREQF